MPTLHRTLGWKKDRSGEVCFDTANQISSHDCLWIQDSTVSTNEQKWTQHLVTWRNQSEITTDRPFSSWFLGKDGGMVCPSSWAVERFQWLWSPRKLCREGSCWEADECSSRDCVGKSQSHLHGQVVRLRSIKFWNAIALTWKTTMVLDASVVTKHIFTEHYLVTMTQAWER